MDTTATVLEGFAVSTAINRAGRDAAFEAAIREHAEALLGLGSTFFQINRTRIIELAAQHHLPAMYAQRQWAEAGA